MVQKEIIAGAAALMVLGGAVLYFANRPSTTAVVETETQTAAVETATTGEAEKFNGSFMDLMGRGGTYECRFSSDVDGSKSEGVVYVSDKKIRGNFMSTVDGKEVRSSMIQDGESMYVWSEAMPKGIKMKAAAMTATGAKAPAGMFDPSLAMNYDCKPWKTDSAWFVAPPNVEFMSL